MSNKDEYLEHGINRACEFLSFEDEAPQQTISGLLHDANVSAAKMVLREAVRLSRENTPRAQLVDGDIELSLMSFDDVVFTIRLSDAMSDWFELDYTTDEKRSEAARILRAIATKLDEAD